MKNLSTFGRLRTWIDMKKDNVVQQKSFAFALRIVEVSRALVNEQKEFVLSKQLLRSGTSIGANIEEAMGGQSKKDFYAKLTIAYKEARETNYWLRLLEESNILNRKIAKELLMQSDELLRIIGSIRKTTRKNWGL